MGKRFDGRNTNIPARWLFAFPGNREYRDRVALGLTGLRDP